MEVSFGNQANEVEIVNFLSLKKFEYSVVAGIAELLNFQSYVNLKKKYKIKSASGLCNYGFLVHYTAKFVAFI